MANKQVHTCFQQRYNIQGQIRLSSPVQEILWPSEMGSLQPREAASIPDRNKFSAKQRLGVKVIERIQVKAVEAFGGMPFRDKVAIRGPPGGSWKKKRMSRQQQGAGIEKGSLRSVRKN